MLSARGLCEYEALRDGHNTLALTLLRAVGEIGDWGVFPTPSGQKIGTWTLEYSMIPYTAAQRSDAYSLGYAFAYPSAIAIATERHAGALPSIMDYVRFDNEYVRMSAFKCAESGDGIILRLFNTATHAVSLTLDIASAFTAAQLTDMAEVPIAELEIENNEIKLDVPQKKILTLKLTHPQ
jgi:alpha-mannosidase